MNRKLALTILLAALACTSTTYFPEGETMARFEAAGPVIPEVDQAALLASLPAPGPYKVVQGDVLEVHGPATMFESGSGPATREIDGSHLARVSTDGSIQVPLAGTIQAGGRTLLEIEADISEAVFPKYLTQKPSVVVRVNEHHTVAVSVIGAVEDPGIHYLKSDQMSLYGALDEAGGILKASNLVVGARRIRIHWADPSLEPEPIVLPVKGLNIPAGDVRLYGGERIEVDRYEPDTFTVVGLVAKPGAYEYPPEVTLNLMQALATAGGVDPIANPPYATVFRREVNGSIIPVTFEIDGDGLVASSGQAIKPGDVIAVQQTPASWTRTFFATITRLQINFFADPLN